MIGKIFSKRESKEGTEVVRRHHSLTTAKNYLFTSEGWPRKGREGWWIEVDGETFDWLSLRQ